MLDPEFVNSVCPPGSLSGDCDGFARKIRFAGEAPAAAALAVDSAPTWQPGDSIPRGFCLFDGKLIPVESRPSEQAAWAERVRARHARTEARSSARAAAKRGAAGELSPANFGDPAAKPSAPLADEPKHRGVRFAGGFKIFGQRVGKK